jgi:segregation and condensation protein A
MAAILGAGATRAPAVAFRDERRPELATLVQLESWEGPLGLLLSLIEARELDVLTVPLGALAVAYLDALGSLDADRIGNVSAFVAVASQLILIKSRALLPRPPAPPEARPDEPSDPEAELRARLLLYRAYRDAGAALLAGGLQRVGLFRREPAAATRSARAGATPLPGPVLPVELLVHALDEVVRVALPPEPPSEVIPRTITLTERARIIRSALADSGTVVLQELLRGVRDKVVVAITFLAMLELMKRREIVVEQSAPWGPIVARSTTAEERAAAGVAPMLDDEPLDESLESFA